MQSEVLGKNPKSEPSPTFKVIDLQSQSLNHYKIEEPDLTGFYYHILWIKKGTSNRLVDFKNQKIPSNALLFFKKSISNPICSEICFDGKAILFTDDFYCRTDKDVSFLNSTTLFNNQVQLTILTHINQSRELNVLMQLLEKACLNSSGVSQWNSMQNLLHKLLNAAEDEKYLQLTGKLQHCIDLQSSGEFKAIVEANYLTEKKNMFYARRMGVTQQRLTQITTRVLGRTPKELIDLRIIAEAKRLLSFTAKTEMEIGFILGFNDDVSFRNMFSKKCGLTPVEFRETADSVKKMNLKILD